MTNYSSIRYASSGTTVYADMNALIAATGSDGAQAFVQSNNNIYVYAGSGWYKIATVQNDSPSAITGVDGTYSLTTDGTPTVITAVSTDPEGFPLTWSYVTSGLGSIATVSQVDNVFTITPSTNSADIGTFTLTINATDGVNGAVSANTSITLQFEILNSNRTTLLATAVDTSDNNNITDSSTNNHTVTVNGAAHAGTFSPYRHGGYSTYFDGSGDYIRYEDASLAEGTDDFTVEFWVNRDGTQSLNDTIVGHDTTPGWQICFNSDGSTIRWMTNATDASRVLPASLNDQQWHHVVYQRDSGTLQGFLDGVSLGTASVSTNFTNNRIEIGVNRGGTAYFTGNVRDVRIIKGTAFYSSSGFDVPTEPLTAVSDTGYSTTLLSCHLPYIVDGGTNSLSPTINGNTSTKPFSPYDYSEYSTANHGGSVDIPNDNDYLYVPHSSTLKPSGTDPFCVSFWYYPTTLPGTDRQLAGDFQVVSYPSNCPGWDILYQTSGAINARWGYPNYADTGSGVTNNVPILNSWNHIVFCRSGGSLSLFLNGKRCNTFTSNISISASGLTNFYVGYAGEASGSAMNSAMGTIADFKYEVGTSQFDATASTITVPTAPQSTTNSVLHIKGTDASIIDKAQSTNLQLVGNTTGSTTQVKFTDTKSMYLDGASDYIITTQQELGTEDFTIEGWHYLLSRSNNRNGIFGNYNSYSAGSLGMFAGHSSGSSTSYQVAYNGAAFPASVIQGGTIVYNQWVHFAVVRNSGIMNLYIDGTSVDSISATASLNGVGSNFIIGAPGDNLADGMQGYLQDFRITKGLARYTANFTPPTEPLKG
jgi:hypothetical protein